MNLPFVIHYNEIAGDRQARVLSSLRTIDERTGNPEQIRAVVRKMKEDGSDVVKLFATASIRDGGKMTMSKEQIEAACGEAKAVGLRSAVHAHASDGATASILAGCTSIEHGTFLDDATLKLMVEHGTFFDPNFLVLRSAFGPRRWAAIATARSWWRTRGRK